MKRTDIRKGATDRRSDARAFALDGCSDARARRDRRRDGLGTLAALDDSFVSASLSFSAQTSSTRVSDGIEARVEKRTKDTFAPPGGKKLAVFIDDFNMPEKEMFGAQPPLEEARMADLLSGREHGLPDESEPSDHLPVAAVLEWATESDGR